MVNVSRAGRLVSDAVIPFVRLTIIPLAAAHLCWAAHAQPLTVTSVTPTIVDPIGGTRVVLRGSGLTGITSVSIGGIAANDVVEHDGTWIEARSLPVGAGSGLSVTVARGAEEATLTAAVEAWSPAQIPGAHLFDAASGISGSTSASTYEWQRLTREIAPDWLQRDGNTLNYLPATGRFWMVAGWNPYPPPDGFDDVDPALGLPSHSTTNEVWSSADGVRWTKELADDHPGFDRRHAHATLLWRNRLWIIGGDWWRQEYNHDVVSSSDGIHWTVELAQTPWPDRALLVAGVYNDKLWVAGGQSLHGPREDFVYHNDVWNSADGVNWVQVAADAPAGPTRWSGRGILNDLVEFNGRMWLVGGGRYRDDAVGSSFFREVWSTTDGVVWTQHTTPPWQGRIWHDVRVWDGKLWMMFGGSNIGNLNDTWYTEDGETWTAFAADRNIHPGSHAQGLAVADDFLLYAGGNYSFGVGPTFRDTDKSAWRLKAFRGVAVDAWTARGTPITVSATAAARPVHDADALGPGISGLQFDGSEAFLSLPDKELQPDGRSVFWVGRAPWVPSAPDWNAPPLLNPPWTVVGDGDEQYCAAGLADGGLYYTSSSSSAGWVGGGAGSDLQYNTGEVRFLGFTHASDGRLQAWVDGAPAGPASNGGYSPFHGWSRIGAGGYAPIASTAYAGTLGAVVILPSAADAATVAKMQRWAQGRFETPACQTVNTPRLTISSLRRPPGAQNLGLSGRLQLGAALGSDEPVATGLRLEINDSNGAALLDVTLPAGIYQPTTETGWKVNRTRTRFSYIHPTGIGAVRNASLTLRRVAGGHFELRFRIRGKGSFAVDPGHLPLQARLSFSAASQAGLCGELRFRQPIKPSCRLRRSRTTATCG